MNGAPVAVRRLYACTGCWMLATYPMEQTAGLRLALSGVLPGRCACWSRDKPEQSPIAKTQCKDLSVLAPVGSPRTSDSARLVTQVGRARADGCPPQSSFSGGRLQAIGQVARRPFWEHEQVSAFASRRGTYTYCSVWHLVLAIPDRRRRCSPTSRPVAVLRCPRIDVSQLHIPL